MPERTEYAPGTPTWIDIGTDVDGAKAFYCGLFGWTSEAAGPEEETGGYGMFSLNGKLVAGYSPQQNPGPPVWTTYIATDDADVAAKSVEAAGGSVVMAAMDVMDAGRMAIFQDPQGAFFSVWQAGVHRGSEVTGDPGTLAWVEMNARDEAVAVKFYGDVFGWTARSDQGGAMPYTEFQLGGTSVAGMTKLPPDVPSEVPAHWLVYFAVDDVDTAASRATELGGSVVMPPTEVEDRLRFAILTDPQGANFGVMRLQH